MTDKTMTLESHAKWLLKAAEEIRSEGHAGWGNTCEQAADAITRHLSQTAEPTKLEDAVREVIANMQLKIDRYGFAGKLSMNEWADKLTAALQEQAK